MSGEVEKCPILHVCPKFDVFTLPYDKGMMMHFSPDSKVGYSEANTQSCFCRLRL